MAAKGKKLSFSHSSSWSLLCCRNGISATSSAPEKEKKSDELSKPSSRSGNYKKPGGWKAMPFILGIALLFLFPSMIISQSI